MGVFGRFLGWFWSSLVLRCVAKSWRGLGCLLGFVSEVMADKARQDEGNSFSRSLLGPFWLPFWVMARVPLRMMFLDLLILS